jgi:hypothetical protein
MGPFVISAAELRSDVRDVSAPVTALVRARAVGGSWRLTAAALSLVAIASLVAMPGLLGRPFLSSSQRCPRKGKA